MATRKRASNRDAVPGLLSETRDLVRKLVQQNRALKTENSRLARDLDRLASGWEEVRKLARSAPRRPKTRN